MIAWQWLVVETNVNTTLQSYENIFHKLMYIIVRFWSFHGSEDDDDDVLLLDFGANISEKHTVSILRAISF
jgi:hypothetical protein